MSYGSSAVASSSRLKPWETSGVEETAQTSAVGATQVASSLSDRPAPPVLPDRPGEMFPTSRGGTLSGGVGGDEGGQQGQAELMAGQAGGMNGVGMPGQAGYGAYGTAGIGGSYGSSYASPYTSGLTSSYGGGGYGGYGSGGYGGYGMSNGFGGGGMGMGMGLGMGMNGYGGGQTPFSSTTSALQASTAPAFAILESLLSTLSSFTHLLESTYVATHSSFFAMAGLADQVGGLKRYVGEVLGALSLVRLLRGMWRWARGRGRAARAGGGGGAQQGGLGGFLSGLSGGGAWAEEWKIGQASGGPADQHSHLRPQSSSASSPNPSSSSGRPSSKPLVLFLISAIGLPYLMTKLVRLLTRAQERAAASRQRLQQHPMGAGGTAGVRQTDLPLKGSITFARTVYPFAASEPYELSLRPDEIVAILQRYEEGNAGAGGSGKELGWWRGRTRDGRVGWFPGNYVEVLRKREAGSSPTPTTKTGSHSSSDATTTVAGNQVRVESRTDSIGSSV